MRIASETGYPFVRRLEHYLTVREFDLWVRWFNERGTADDRTDYRHGMLCAILARAFGSRSADPLDFMLSRILDGEGGGEQSPVIQRVIVDAWAERVNMRFGADKGNGD